MEKNRLEAFSDGVLAIVITIMVLELKQPEGAGFADLMKLWPILGTYILSFLFVATYWVNHHMLFQKVERINLKILWCNIAWLFVISLIPFTTAWVGVYPTSRMPLLIYFADMALVSFTFHLMYNLIAAEHGQEVTTKQKVRNYVSMGVYILVAVLAGFCPIAAYIAVAVVTIWGIIPQKKEKSKSV
jgi:uncharacterized membrane protein